MVANVADGLTLGPFLARVEAIRRVAQRRDVSRRRKLAHSRAAQTTHVVVRLPDEPLVHASLPRGGAAVDGTQQGIVRVTGVGDGGHSDHQEGEQSDRAHCIRFAAGCTKFSSLRSTISSHVTASNVVSFPICHMLLDFACT